MKQQAPTPTPLPASDSQRAALITLLADEDPAVYAAVRNIILASGPELNAWLRPHLLSNDPLLRRRALGIVRHFARQEADVRFLTFCLKHGQAFDLEQAIWLLAATEYPDINIDAYQALLDHYTAGLRNRIDFSDEPGQILGTINSYLFDDLGFTGNDQDYYAPENSYMNRVLDRRTGNPSSLCLVYMLIARRLHLPITGVGLPGHFVCRYQSSSDELYVDVFHNGRILTKADCIQYLAQGNYSMREDCMAPLTPRRILMRVCSNLYRIYVQIEQAEKATQVQRYVVALSR